MTMTWASSGVLFAESLRWTGATFKEIRAADPAEVQSDALFVGNLAELTVQLVTTHNQTLTGTFQGSLDESSPTNWSDLPYPDAEAISLPANSTKLLGLSETLLWLRLKVVKGTDPTAGDLRIRVAGRTRGD